MRRSAGTNPGGRALHGCPARCRAAMRREYGSARVCRVRPGASGTSGEPSQQVSARGAEERRFGFVAAIVSEEATIVSRRARVTALRSAWSTESASHVDEARFPSAGPHHVTNPGERPRGESRSGLVHDSRARLGALRRLGGHLERCNVIGPARASRLRAGGGARKTPERWLAGWWKCRCYRALPPARSECTS